ncbi:MAG: hypothetical protein KAI47_08575 [Deltaproteobacteria bacterium]|nr:hypothetical protein [Deltaproteobacteria bacterium]
MMTGTTIAARWISTVLTLAAVQGCKTTAPSPPPTMLKRSDNLTRILGQMEASPAARPWQTRVSTNIRVRFRTRLSHARRVLADAEKHRQDQLLWWRRAITPVWQPKCEVFLFPSTKAMRRSGRGQHFAAFSMAHSARLTPGLMLKRQINLASTDRYLLINTLPHEMSHVVLAGLLPNVSLPLWANEGLATLWESRASRRGRGATIALALALGRAFPLHRLLMMARYPTTRRNKAIYYAQAMSLVEVFLQMADREVFLAFLAEISPSNYLHQRTTSWATIAGALAKHYAITDLSILEARWSRWVRARSLASATEQ